jgi:hypothetical protein
MRTLLIAFALLTAVTPGFAASYTAVPDWLKLPAGKSQLGNQHGDVAVSSKGEIYVSVMDPQAGVQVFAADGKFLRNVPNAPSDFHGFVIRKDVDGQEYLYGPRLQGQSILKMSLDGTIVLEIPATAIPDQFKKQAPAPAPKKKKDGTPAPAPAPGRAPDRDGCGAERGFVCHGWLRERLRASLRPHGQVSEILRRQAGALQFQHAAQDRDRHALQPAAHHRLRPREPARGASVARG